MPTEGLEPPASRLQNERSAVELHRLVRLPFRVPHAAGVTALPDVAALVRRERRVAIRANHPQVLQLPVVGVAVLVVHHQRDRLTSPLPAATQRTTMTSRADQEPPRSAWTLPPHVRVPTLKRGLLPSGALVFLIARLRAEDVRCSLHRRTALTTRGSGLSRIRHDRILTCKRGLRKPPLYLLSYTGTTKLGRKGLNLQPLGSEPSAATS